MLKIVILKIFLFIWGQYFGGPSPERVPVNLKSHLYPYFFFQNFCQQTAALALGRLANYNDDLAEAVVKSDILPQLVYSLAEQNRFYKKEKDLKSFRY